MFYLENYLSYKLEFCFYHKAFFSFAVLRNPLSNYKISGDLCLQVNVCIYP